MSFIKFAAKTKSLDTFFATMELNALSLKKSRKIAKFGTFMKATAGTLQIHRKTLTLYSLTRIQSSQCQLENCKFSIIKDMTVDCFIWDCVRGYPPNYIKERTNWTLSAMAISCIFFVFGYGMKKFMQDCPETSNTFKFNEMCCYKVVTF